MASLSNINGIFDVHSTGAILFSTSHGTSGQILRSNGNAAPTWVAASTVIGGPYLPLTGGTLTGPLSGTSATFAGTVTAGSGSQAVNSDAMLTLRATAYSGLDIKSARTTGNIGGIRFYDTASNTVPEAQLNVEVDGSYNFYNGTNGAQLRLKITDYGSLVVGNTPGTNSNWGKIQCGGTITVGNSSGTYKTHGRISGDSDGMKLKGTSTGTYSNPQGVTINGYNVGINTDSPSVGNAYGLVIRSFTNPSRLVFWNNTSGEVSSRGQRISFENANCIFENMESGYYAFKTGGSSANPSERMRIDSSGNVGINTTVFPSSGFAKLVVAGSAIAARPSGVNDYFSYIKSNWALENAFEIGIEGAGTQHRFITSGNYYHGTELRFWTSDTQRVTINSIGNVGINENSPSQTLDVNGQMTHNGLVMKSGDGVYIDRYLAYTINISLIAFNWVDTGIYSNSGSYQLGASGTYAVQIYSDSHAGEPYWYNAYWSGIMSWHQGSVNQNATFEIPLTQAAHSTNGRTLELRIQNTLGSGPGTPTNNARLELKTTAAGTNSVSLSFRFRRLI
jgi:hypothetical protein